MENMEIRNLARNEEITGPSNRSGQPSHCCYSSKRWMNYTTNLTYTNNSFTASWGVKTRQLMGKINFIGFISLVVISFVFLINNKQV